MPWLKKLRYNKARISSSRSSSSGTRMIIGPKNIDHAVIWNGIGLALTDIAVYFLC